MIDQFAEGTRNNSGKSRSFEENKMIVLALIASLRRYLKDVEETLHLNTMEALRCLRISI